MAAEIRHQVWIDAPLATVFAALATAEGVSRWWNPQTPVQTERGLVLEHDPGPEHGVVRMLVVGFVPHRSVEWECISCHPPDTPGASWTGSRIRFDVVERKEFPPANAPWAAAIPAQTILEFRHAGLDDASPYFAMCSFAWGEVLLKLQQVCQGQGRATGNA